MLIQSIEGERAYGALDHIERVQGGVADGQVRDIGRRRSQTYGHGRADAVEPILNDRRQRVRFGG